MDLLCLLVERRGQLVIRADIVEHLWGKDVFVDAETGINTVVWKLRNALRDSSEDPGFHRDGVRGRATDSSRLWRWSSDQCQAVKPLQEPPSPRPTTQPGHPSHRTAAMPSEGVAGGPRRTVWTGDGPCAVDQHGRTSPQAIRRRSSWAWLCLPHSVCWLGVVEAQRGGYDDWRCCHSRTWNAIPSRTIWLMASVEETIVSLGQVDPERLSVIGRTSMMAYKHTAKSLVEIGRELSVDYLVESSIRAEGDRLRVTRSSSARQDQVQVWSASYDREASSMLAVQRELNTAIAQQVRIRLLPDRLGGLERRQP